jgi:hypothetical protein
MAYNPFRHFGLKALSVVIAALLWVLVGGEKIVERSLRVPHRRRVNERQSTGAFD